jgi:hypothetical protein
LAGGVPGRGWWWRELKEANKPPADRKIAKTALKTPFFAQKYLTRYAPKMFLRNTLILNFFLLL